MNEHYRAWLISVHKASGDALQGMALEYRDEGDTRWQPKPDGQSFLRGCDYRAVQPTIKINGFDVPKPMERAPEMNSEYFLPSLGSTGYYCKRIWTSDAQDKIYLNGGVVHNNKAAAIAHAKAMLGLDTNAEV